jgi:1-acyl-sn-glycerol-3-phosphate acyltransferase
VTQSSLLHQRRFLPLFVTQFFGALNDNVFKNALVVLLTFKAAEWTTIAPSVLANLAAGIFILPFFLFSATAGQLADKFDKAGIARLVKLLEIAIMLLAGTGFAMHSLALLLTALFLMGCHSTLFGPVKYAILPQHLQPGELVGGNALIEAGTFVAILLGTILGGVLAAAEGGTVWITLAALAIAVAGYLASRFIPSAPAPDAGLRLQVNPFVETWRVISHARGNRTVFLSILGISWFWLFGALFLAQFPAYAKDVLGGGELSVTLLLAVFTIGIGVGSLACERMSAGRVELGLVPLGSIGLTVFALDIAFASPSGLHIGSPLDVGTLLGQWSTWHVLIDLLLVGLFGGFFIVPLYTLMQERSEATHRARIIAANNILNALFIVVGSLGAAGLLASGLSIPALFGVAAVCNAAVALFIYKLVPEFLVRFVVWLLVHSIYRLDKRGIDLIPATGPALLVSNHVSFVDALVIAAACPRPIRFIMDHNVFRWPVLNFVFRETRAIPIASAKEDPAAMELAFDAAARALEAGELVAIFPEGRLTDNGDIATFRKGMSRILDRTQVTVPVVPMALRGLWGSYFSRKDGPAMTKPFRRGLFSRIELAVGAPRTAAEAAPERMREDVATLRGDWR